MLPYFRAPEKTLIEHVPLLGPLKLQFFGPLVALGVLLGYQQGLRYAKQRDIDENIVRDLMFWVVVVGFAFAHWVSVLFYFPEQVVENPWVLLAFTNGLSSVGGFFGAYIGMIWWLKKNKQPILIYADLLIFALLLGWVFGRLGCSIVHDHPGAIAEAGTFWAVGPWPDGKWRYDLGFFEFLFTLALTGYVYFVADWRHWQPGRLVGLVTLAYAPFRFGLDFLRADDVRYGGLTAAQYFTVVFAGVGVWLLFFRKADPRDYAWTKDSERKQKLQAETNEPNPAEPPNPA